MSRLVLSLLLAICISTASLASGPKIECLQPVFDFGKTNEQETVSHDFILKNAGDADLVIDRIVGCCGATTKIREKNVLPGSNTVLTVDFSLEGRIGRVDKSIFVESNDPSQRLFCVNLRGATTADIEADPVTLDFGVVEQAREVEKEVAVTISPESGLRLTNVLNNASNLSVQLVAPEAPGKPYRIIARTVPPLSVGVMVGDLKLVTDDPEGRFAEVTVLYRVHSDFVVVPRELTFVRSAKTPQVRSLVIRSRAANSFSITSIDLPDPVFKADHYSLRPGLVRVNVSLNSLPPTNRTSLVIHTDLKGSAQRLEVHVELKAD